MFTSENYVRNVCRLMKLEGEVSLPVSRTDTNSITFRENGREIELDPLTRAKEREREKDREIERNRTRITPLASILAAESPIRSYLPARDDNNEFSARRLIPRRPRMKSSVVKLMAPRAEH